MKAQICESALFLLWNFKNEVLLAFRMDKFRSLSRTVSGLES